VGRLTPLDWVLLLVSAVLAVPLLGARSPLFGDWLAMLGAAAVALLGWMVLLPAIGMVSEPELRSRIYSAAATAPFLPRDVGGRRIAGVVLILLANTVPMALLLAPAFGTFVPALGFFAVETALVVILVLEAVID
jgi:hypothetical protein